MARKLIHDDASKIGRLRCDNADCGYVLPEPLEWSESLIGHSCPRCGDSMLTRIDYVAVERMRKMVRFINRWFGWLGTERPQPHHTRHDYTFVNGKPTRKVR